MSRTMPSSGRHIWDKATLLAQGTRGQQFLIGKGKPTRQRLSQGAMTSLLDQARWAGPPCSAPQKQSIHRLLCHLGCRSCLKPIASGIVPTLGSALTSGKPSGQIEMPAAGVNWNESFERKQFNNNEGLLSLIHISEP